jgi:cell filamentation protein
MGWGVAGHSHRKGDNWLCYPGYIQNEAERLFGELAARGYLAADEDRDTFAQEAAWFLAEHHPPFS